MNNVESTVDLQEINKFSQHARNWWDKEGPLKTLHDINPTRLEFICQHTDLKKSKVLDVGCGGGILCEAMVKAGAEVIGIDAEEEVINVAKNHAKENKLSVEYFCTPIEEYESELFDVITCMELLEHVSKPELVINHCKRLLKPGGVLFLSTINRTLKAYLSVILAAEYVLNLLPKQTHEYNKFIKPSELVVLARQQDLNLIDLKGMNYNPLSGFAALNSNVSVNYLLAFR